MASSPNQGITPNGQQPHKLVSNDLDSSLANLVGSEFPLLRPMLENAAKNLNDGATNQELRSENSSDAFLFFEASANDCTVIQPVKEKKAL